VGTGDGRIHLVDAETGTARWEVLGYPDNDRFISVEMSPDGRFVASVSNAQESWKLWDAASGIERMAGVRHDGTGACMCRVTSSGRRLTRSQRCPVRAHTSGLCAVAFSPCGQRLATGGGLDDQTVVLWDARTGHGEHAMQSHTDAVTSVSFSADGLRLASGSYDGSICVWDATTGALLRTIQDEAHESGVECVQFSPRDNNTLAAVGFPSGFVLQWDVASGESIRGIRGCMVAEFSPDAGTIATLSVQLTDAERNVQLTDAETGIVRSTIVCNQQQSVSISFSSDGRKLATGGSDGSCKVWDSSTGALIRTIQIGNAVHSISWARDWVRDGTCVAFAMGHHPRLGAGSRVLALEVGVVRMILDRV